MKLKGTEDLRIRRTITSLKKAFEELICEKDYDTITVTELSERAVINKKTFYQYYKNLNELLDELTSDFSSRYLEEIAKYQIPEDLEQINRTFFTFSAAAGKVYDRMILSGNQNILQKNFMEQTMHDYWHRSKWFMSFPENVRSILFQYVQNATIGIYRQWVLDGRKLPLEELVQLSYNLIYQGINSLLF